MSKTRTEYRCPLCGGTNIQDLCTVWIDANTSEIQEDEMYLAEMYSDTRWCVDCEKHPTQWIEVEVPIEPAQQSIEA